MISSVLKAIEILEIFTTQKPLMKLGEISSALGYPKTTVYTILSTLETKGLIERDGSGRYALGSAIIPMTQAVRVNVEVRDRAAPLLRLLNDFSKESVYLTIHDGMYCLYIYAVESPDRLMARTAVGERVLMHCTAVGKAILSFMNKEEIDAIIDQTGLEQFNERTITTREALYQELDETRKRGYSIDRAEHEEKTYCLGSPIFDKNGKVFASCSISGSDPEIIGTKMQSLSEGVRYTSQEISRRMGFVPRGDTLLWKNITNPMRKGVHEQ